MPKALRHIAYRGTSIEVVTGGVLTADVAPLERAVLGSDGDSDGKPHVPSAIRRVRG